LDTGCGPAYDAARYGAIPFAHGLYKFQVENLKPDFAETAKTYFEDAFE
jgi:hypothetical protein